MAARTGKTASVSARYFLPRPTPVRPHLAVFITDGNPNKSFATTASPTTRATPSPP